MWISRAAAEMCYIFCMKQRMSIGEYLALPEVKGKGRNKFGAKKTEYGGRVFDSAKEAKRAHDLWLLKLAGEVAGIEYQVPFDCVVNGKLVCKYVADFRVTYRDGRVEVEDVKGYKKGAAYATFRIKKKLVEALHGIAIVEV